MTDISLIVHCIKRGRTTKAKEQSKLLQSIERRAGLVERLAKSGDIRGVLMYSNDIHKSVQQLWDLSNWQPE